MSYDYNALNNIGESLDVMGQLMGVVVCKQHPDRILSGRHRTKKGAKEVYQLDIDARRATLPGNISHEVYEQLCVSHFNVQRNVSQDERKAEVIRLANQLVSEGTPKELVAAKMVPLLKGVIHKSYLYSLLDAEFKNQVMSESIKEGRREPYAKGMSELASQHVEKVNTPAKVKLLEIVNRAIGPHFRQEEAFDRGTLNKRTKQPLFYSVDVVLDCGIGLEAEGAGTSSDDPEREKFILEHQSVGGFKVTELKHLPNRLIEEFPLFVEDYIRLVYQVNTKK